MRINRCVDSTNVGFGRCWLGVWLVLAGPSITYAGNGANLIGFGIESNLLAGADVAVSRDTGAASTNPAGLSQINGTAIDSQLGVAYGPNVGHRDQFGNDVRVDKTTAIGGSLGFARHSSDSDFAFGFGLFGQGGAGSVYGELNTAFGTRDELSARFRIAKINPALAYRFSDQLSLGIAIPIIYSDLEQKVFPNTSRFNAAQPLASFFGSELAGMKASNAGVKLGLMYRPTERMTLGLTYSNQVKLTQKDGTLKVNYDDIGLGRVTYRDVEVVGLHLPQELAFGAAQRVGERWLLSIKWAWLDWSRAFRSSTLNARSPDNASAPHSLSSTAKLNWRDQYVVAIGLAYEATPATMMFVGYNYGRNPIPAETTSPLLVAFTEQHATLGFTHKFGSHWAVSAGFQYDAAKSVTYTNPELPFGVDARERNEVFGLHLAVGRRW